MRGALARLGLALLITLTLLAVYGVLVEPRLIMNEERFDVTLPRLAADAPERTVAVFSDLQIGMWFANEDMVSDIVERVVEERPAAALVAGDFVYSESPDIDAQVDRVVELLTPLTDAGIPTFAVLGNHDHAVGAVAELTTALTGIGIPVLRNEAAPIPGAGPLHVVGLGPARPGQDDAAAAFSAIPDDAPRVVVMHNPSTYPALPPRSAPLSVAGHTHCGQIAVPGFPAWSYLALTAPERVVVSGWAEDSYGAPGNSLYVNCGIGFSVVPMRVAAPPQVVFFELTGPAAPR